MVYVDNPRHPFGRMLMAHLMADSTDELISMVDWIRIPRKWIQSPGTPREHFDICASKRLKAIRLGAIPVSSRDLALLIRKRTPLPLELDQ